MKRKMVYAGITYLVGLFFASCFDNTSGIVFAAAAAAVSSLVCCAAKIKLKYFVFCVCFFLTGFGIYKAYDGYTEKNIRIYEGVRAEFTGRITMMEKHSDDKSSYRLRGKINGKTGAEVIWYGQTGDCGYGDTVRLVCTFSGLENTYLFSQKDYYESQGIYLQVSNAESAEFIKNRSFSPVKVIRNYRDHICSFITGFIPGPPGALITAMLTGDRSGLDDSESSSMYRTGIGHVMAVSGMHLVLLTSAVSLLLKRAGAGKKLQFAVIETVIVLFTVFTGMSVSVLRSAFMVTLIYSSHIFSRRTDPLNSLCIAVMFFTLTRPYLISNPSFLLSVSGTFGSAVFAPYVTSGMDESTFLRKLKKDILYMFCVSVSVFPFSLMFFDETSVVSPFTNILLMPLCEFILMCGFVCAASGGLSFLSCPCLIAGGLAGKLLMKISDMTASLSFVSVPSGPEYIPVLTAVLAVLVAAGVILFADRKLTALMLSVSLMVMSISGVVYRRAESDVLSIYRLGTANSTVYVIVKDGTADIADLTGSRKNVRYVKKALDRSGIRKTGSLVFTKNPYQAMALYDESMRYRKTENVLVPEGTYFKDSRKICGCTPQESVTAGTQIIYDDYSIVFESRDTLNITYSDVSVICGKKAVSVCEGSAEEKFENSNILVRIDSSGRTDIINLDENG